MSNPSLSEPVMSDSNEKLPVLSEETVDSILDMDESERPQKVYIAASDYEKLQGLTKDTEEAVKKVQTLFRAKRRDWVGDVATKAIDNVEASSIAKQALRYPLGILYGYRAVCEDVNLTSKRIEDFENALQNLAEFSDPEVEKAARYYRELFERGLQKEKEFEAKGGKCFIATAAYGSEMAADVIMLRQFRDQFLRPRKIGTLFIQVYERLSPPLAQWLSRHESWRWGVREIMIQPLTRLLQRLIN